MAEREVEARVVWSATRWELGFSHCGEVEAWREGGEGGYTLGEAGVEGGGILGSLATCERRNASLGTARGADTVITKR
jgi:hypothetical protein